MTDFYELLGVEHDAPPEKIRVRYRLLARKYHPDIADPNSTVDFSAYSQAYHILSDPERRKNYNEEIRVFVLPRLLAPGQDSHQRLSISPSLAQTGGKTMLSYLLYEPCPRCWLAGCERCEETGMLPEQVEIQI